jgi:hypothetical protein
LAGYIFVLNITGIDIINSLLENINSPYLYAMSRGFVKEDDQEEVPIV